MVEVQVQVVSPSFEEEKVDDLGLGLGLGSWTQGILLELVEAQLPQPKPRWLVRFLRSFFPLNGDMILI